MGNRSKRNNRIRAKLKKIYDGRIADSRKELEDLKDKHKGEKVYGEATWSGVNQMIKHFRPLTKDDVFLDIGSGRGKMVLHMALQTPVKKCIGVELVKSRHEDAIKLKVKVSGPVPADSSFVIFKKYKYNVIVGMYHDQVLTPYKALYNLKSLAKYL